MRSFWGDPVGKSEDSTDVQRYELNKRRLIEALKDCLELHQPTKIKTRDMASAINRACQHFGYRSGATASIVGKRELVRHERDHLVLTPIKAGYFACAFALYGDEDWADTPEQVLHQVYSWCLFGTPNPPPDADKADIARLNAMPKTIQLELIRPIRVEPIEEREEIAAHLRVATPEAVADYLEALAENIRGLAQQPPDDDDDDEPPCDEQCVMASYLRLGGKVGLPITDADREAVAAATGIPLPRVSRLLCGDPWTPAEAAAIERYGSTNFILAALAAAAGESSARPHNL